MSSPLHPARMDPYSMTQDQRRELEDLSLTRAIRSWSIEEVADEIRAMEVAMAGIETVEKFGHKNPNAVVDDYLWHVVHHSGLSLGDDLRKWVEPTGYLVPTTTGPYWIVGPDELVTTAVGQSSLVFMMPQGGLVAVRPQGVAIPDPTPVRWRRLVGAIARGRAGLLWIPPQGYGD